MGETLEEALKDIEITKARAIINEVIRGGFKEDDIPETEQALVEEAQYWYEEAFKIHETGVKEDTVLAILGIMDDCVVQKESKDISDYVEIPVEEDEWSESEKEKALEAGRELRNPGYSSGVPPRSSGGYSESDLREGDIGKQYNLPIPRDWEGEPEDMPRDISDLSDRDVRRISGEYNAYLSRAKWLFSVEIADLANSTHLRDHAYRVALRKIPRVDSATDKAKLKEVIDAEAREDAEFAKYDEAVLYHQNRVGQLKALVDIYSGNVDRLSREWTMRQDEYEKSVR